MFFEDFFDPHDSIGNALVKDAQNALDARDKDEAVKILREGADDGHAVCAVRLAQIFVEDDPVSVEAGKLLEAALPSGLVVALRMRAEYLQRIDEASIEARKLFTLAAAKGDRKSVNHISEVLRKEGLHYDEQTVQAWAQETVENFAVSVLSRVFE